MFNLGHQSPVPRTPRALIRVELVVHVYSTGLSQSRNHRRWFRSASMMCRTRREHPPHADGFLLIAGAGRTFYMCHVRSMRARAPSLALSLSLPVALESNDSEVSNFGNFYRYGANEQHGCISRVQASLSLPFLAGHGRAVSRDTPVGNNLG